MRALFVVVIAVLTVALASSCAPANAAPPTTNAPRYDSAFWKTWGDGQAELAGYTLKRARYGEIRSGHAVLIFVTEPWSTSTHVKADDGKHPASDVIQVLKLNTVEDFQTGIYDYNLMTSSWIALQNAPGRPAGGPAKVAFSAQEWCGTTWSDVVFDDRGANEVVRSYFDGETTARALANPPGAVTEDTLLLWARGLASPVVARGGSVEVPLLPSLTNARLRHKPLAWTKAKLARDATTSTIKVPAGSFEVERATATIDSIDSIDSSATSATGATSATSAGPRTVEIFVEVAAPNRIVKVTSSDGTVMELTGATRMPYWQKQREGDEALLAKLGLR